MYTADASSGNQNLTGSNGQPGPITTTATSGGGFFGGFSEAFDTLINGIENAWNTAYTQAVTGQPPATQPPSTQPAASTGGLSGNTALALGVVALVAIALFR